MGEHDIVIPKPRRPWRRRWPWLLLALVVTTVAVASYMWFMWLPNYRPGLHRGEQYGIDVSAHQGRITWFQVARDNIAFAYVKATEGNDFTDPRFKENWIGAGNAGLDRGAYHFFTLCSSGAEQAAHFLAVLPPDIGEMPAALDLEFLSNCRARPSREEFRTELLAFVNTVEQHTKSRVRLYISDDFERRYHVRKLLTRPQWRLRFLRRPDTDDWVVWQVDGFAHIAGISGRVDLDIRQLPGSSHQTMGFVAAGRP